MSTVVKKGLLYVSEDEPDKVGFYCPGYKEIH